MQKSCFLLADAGSGSDIVVGGVADYVVVAAAAVGSMTRMGMNRRIVVDYNRSVGGTGRLPWWAGGALDVAPICIEEIAGASGCSYRV